MGEDCILMEWKVRTTLSILSWWFFLIYKSNILLPAFLGKYKHTRVYLCR